MPITSKPRRGHRNKTVSEVAGRPCLMSCAPFPAQIGWSMLPTDKRFRFAVERVARRPWAASWPSYVCVCVVVVVVVVAAAAAATVDFVDFVADFIVDSVVASAFDAMQRWHCR
jgi:hypothetical protein